MSAPLVRRAVARMRAYHPPLEGRGGKLRLDFNENTVGCAPAVRAALAGLSREAVASYPEYEATRRRLAHFFRVHPDEMLLTAGTDDALRLAVDVLVEPGERVLLVEPTFAMYRFYTERAGSRVQALKYDAAMRFPTEAVLRALRSRQRPRLLMLANPNNPTGTLIPARELRRILAAARGTWVLVDEAYYEFCEVTALGWLRRYPHLLVTRTFSKAHGLAGMRIGCLFAQRATAAALRKAHSPYPVTTPSLAAAEAAVADRRFVRDYLRAVAAGKRILVHALARLGILQFPSAANFVLADFGSRAPDVLRRLARRGILLRDRRSDFGRTGYVRITVGTPAQMRRLVRALEEIW